jgi:ADP-ribose pyrophosphatase
MLKELRQKRSEVILENPYWQYRLDWYEGPDGAERDYHYVHTPGSVMVIPVSGSGKFVMVQQYRYLNRRESTEFPGGGVKPEQSAEDAARNELREETGFSADKLTPIGIFNPMNGVTDELCTVFVATGLKPGTASHDTTEEFVITEISYEECLARIKSGSLWDGMTLAAIALFNEHKKDFLENK